jgi:ribosomal protein S18 acetylase RimI-like enzyme
MIRLYQPDDAPALTAVHNRLYPHLLKSPVSFHAAVEDSLSAGGTAWTLVEPEIAGFAEVTPVSGLPHIGELSGFIAGDKQRQGLGTFMLQQMLASLQSSEIRQVSYHVEDLNAPAGRFFKKNRFFLEHEEIVMRNDQLAGSQSVLEIPSLTVKTFAREKTIPLFCQLFAASFSGLPWDQPYSDEEVAAALDRADDILFLIWQGDPAGFAWMHAEKDGLGVIEPLGIIPSCQGRGFGRFLLSTTLHELAREGIKRAQIGAWKSNIRAIYLYKSLGFRETQRVSYLAFDL